MAASDLLPVVAGQAYALLFALVAIEGPAATVAAGTLVGAGALLWPMALLVAVVADLTADTAYYLAGRLGHRPVLRRQLRRLGLDEQRDRRLRSALSTHLGPTVLGAKVLDAAAVPVLLAAGLARIGYARLLAWNLLATVPRAGVLLVLGVVAGPQVTALLDRLDLHPLAALVVVPALAVGALAVARRLSRPRPLPGPSTPTPEGAPK